MPLKCCIRSALCQCVMVEIHGPCIFGILLQVKMPRMRQRIAERLKEAQNVNAMLTTFNEVDMRFVLCQSTSIGV